MRDAHADRATDMVAVASSEAIVRDIARAEIAAVVGRLHRTGISRILRFRRMYCCRAATVAVLSIDLMEAETILRRLDLGLRAPDALHIAIVRRVGATLATFDNRMADAARILALHAT